MNPAAGGTPRMSTATKAGLFTFLAVLALAAFGYASAALSLPGCVAATRDAVAATGIQGITFGYVGMFGLLLPLDEQMIETI